MYIRITIDKNDIKKILTERGVEPDCDDIAITNAFIVSNSEAVIYIKCIEKRAWGEQR